MAPAVLEKPTEMVVSVREVSRDEALAILHRQAERLLGISGEDFLHRWQAGEYAVDLDRPVIMRLAALVNLLDSE